MKWWAILQSFTFLLIVAQGSQPVRRNNSVTLNGRVSDSVGRSLKGVTITVTDADGKAIATAMTDDTGEYSLRGLSPGNVSLNAEALGFTRSKSLQTLGVGQNLWDTCLFLGRLAEGGTHSIHGRALTTDGGVIPNATITLMSVFDSRVSGQVRTNAEGNYSITTSEPGQYALTAARCNYQASADTVVFPFDDNSNRTVDFHLRKGPACS